MQILVFRFLVSIYYLCQYFIGGQVDSADDGYIISSFLPVFFGAEKGGRAIQ